MHRFTSAVLLGAGVLVTTWVAAPAAPSAPPARVSEADLARIDELATLVTEVVQEAERLRARLAVVPDVPAPRRDPFRFGGRRPDPAPNPEPVPEVTRPVDATPTMLWPTLAAVMAAVGDAGDVPTRTAVMAWGDAIEFLKAGEDLGDFRVVTVSVDAVELLHVPTASTRRVTLR